MQIRLLGPVDLLDGPAVRTPAGQRRTALLAVLALHPREVVTVDHLVDVVWGDDPPPTVHNALQSHVSYLRRLLGGRMPVVSRPPGYVLDVPDSGTDVQVVERLVGRAGHEDDPGVVARLLAEALGLWRGPTLAGVDDLPHLRDHADRLEQVRLGAVEALLDARLDLGEDRGVITELEALAAAHPLRERFHAQLMLALYRAGRQGDALRCYRRARRVLADDLGVEPGPALRALEEAVLRQDPSLEPAPYPRAPAPVTGGGPPRPRWRRPPAPVSSLIGRDAELEQLRTLVGRSRVVTVVGAGGTGKTRLCLESVRQVGPAFPDGAVFVDLARADGGTVLRHLTEAVGIGREVDEQAPHAVQAALEDRHVLVLLDNCEHVIDAAAELVETLVATCPGVHVLATSREPLRLSGEECLPLQPMPVPPVEAADDADALLGYSSVVLFTRRAAATDPGFRLDVRTARPVAEICRRLDGIPLALELAAARLRSMTAEEIAAALDDRFSLLTGGPRTSAPRQRTLRTSVEWSYRLLTRQEQSFFRAVGAFAGTAAIDQVAEVCAAGDRGAALDQVAGLIDKSLLVRSEHEGRTRIGMHETLRSLARELLAAGAESDVLAGRHAEAYRRLATTAREQVHGPEGPATVAALDLEYPNLRAALRWASARDVPAALDLGASLWWFWFRTSRAGEGRQWLDAALGDPAARRSPWYHVVVGATGYLAWVQDDYAVAEWRAREVLDDSTAGDPARALALGVLARALGDRGHFEAASDAAVRSAEMYRATGDRWGAACSRRAHASALLYLGRRDHSREVGEECLAEFRELDDAWGVAGTLDLLAAVANRSGEHRRAIALATEAVDRHRRLADTSGTRYALQHLAEAARADGDLGLARATAEESLVLARENGYRVGALQALLLLGEVALAEQDRAAALRFADEAALLARRAGDRAAEEQARTSRTVAEALGTDDA